MASIINPNALRDIVAQAEEAKMEGERKQKILKEKLEKEMSEAFLAREIHPDVMDRINNAVSQAAKLGFNEILVAEFPGRLCNDRGRRINNGDSDWPESLEGFAKKAYEFYGKELRPLGYKMTAKITSFPGGIPGDVALYLKW